MIEKLENPARRNLMVGGLTFALVGETQALTSKKLSNPLSKTSDLSEETFSEAKDLLERISIDTEKEFAVVLVRDIGTRILGIRISHTDIEKLSRNGGKLQKGILEIEVKRGGAPSEFIIRGNKNGEIFRYGILGFKDVEGITLFDEEEEIYFGKEGSGSKPPSQTEEPIEAASEKPQKISGSFRKKPIHLSYSPRNPEKRINVGNLPDKESFKGRVIRSIRWKPITDAVEDRYRIPQGLILAMMAQEGYGDPTLPNMNNDGGLGLIHIQAVNAHDFGLKTLPRYSKRMRDGKHAGEINRVKAQFNDDLKKMIGYDDRFHPIMAVDVAARFLMERYRRAKKSNPKLAEQELWNLALKGYSGRPHSGKRGYGAKVRAYQAGVTAKSYLQGISKEFPKYEVAINGGSVSFGQYLKHFEGMCENYDLGKYKSLGKYKKA